MAIALFFLLLIFGVVSIAVICEREWDFTTVSLPMIRFPSTGKQVERKCIVCCLGQDLVPSFFPGHARLSFALLEIPSP